MTAHQNKHPVQDEEYNYHESLQAHLTEGIGFYTVDILMHLSSLQVSSELLLTTPFSVITVYMRTKRLFDQLVSNYVRDYYWNLLRFSAIFNLYGCVMIFVLTLLILYIYCFTEQRKSHSQYEGKDLSS